MLIAASYYQGDKFARNLGRFEETEYRIGNIELARVFSKKFYEDDYKLSLPRINEIRTTHLGLPPLPETLPPLDTLPASAFEAAKNNPYFPGTRQIPRVPPMPPTRCVIS